MPLLVLPLLLRLPLLARVLPEQRLDLLPPVLPAHLQQQDGRQSTAVLQPCRTIAMTMMTAMSRWSRC